MKCRIACLIVVLCGFLSLTAAGAQSQTEPASQSQSQRTPLATEKIVERLYTEWQVTPDTFYHVLPQVQISLPRESDAVRATIQTIDLSIYQLSKRGRGRAGHVETMRGPIVALCQQILNDVARSGDWIAPVFKSDFPGGLTMLQNRAEAMEYGDPIPGIPREEPAPK